MRWTAKDYTSWHPHFTLVPTRVSGEWVWGERILRSGQQRGIPGKSKKYWEWQYINSEFDLIKQNADQAINKAQAEMGPMMAQSAKGLVQAGIQTIKDVRNANSIY
jgi:hypothetical protein